jgi:Na+/H+-dicarboxylate symporter
MAKVSPLPFFKGMSDAVMVAFSTCSSAATLPVAMHCVQKNLGVSKDITSFVMPLGSTVNMNGAALFQGMSAVFLAQVYNIELGWQSILAIVVTATFSSIGAAGIPGAGFVMLSYVFISVGLPIEGVALFVSIDRIREMISTVLNVLGDAVTAVYIAKEEGELDECRYYHEEVMELEGDEV